MAIQTNETLLQTQEIPSSKYSTAAGRWAGLGPYYAMFPSRFSDQILERYTKPGDVVFDPFSGRGTALFSAASKNRIAVGIEISPVGWIYSKAKLRTAPKASVLDRLAEVEGFAAEQREEVKRLPEFFHHAYCEDVLSFLLAARHLLKWRQRPADWTLMALILVDLHGKRGYALSNQMRQTKAMWPEYSIRWWHNNGMATPPNVHAGDLMRKKINWRYLKGVPKVSLNSQVLLGDSAKVLDNAFRGVRKSINLLFTSPPYPGVTNYHSDQWIRLWLLGGAPRPIANEGDCHRGRFYDIQAYKRLLGTVLSKAATRLDEGGVIYIRTENRRSTKTLTIQLLQEIFPRRTFSEVEYVQDYNTQTMLFGDTSLKEGEVDIFSTR